MSYQPIICYMVCVERQGLPNCFWNFCLALSPVVNVSCPTACLFTFGLSRPGPVLQFPAGNLLPAFHLAAELHRFLLKSESSSSRSPSLMALLCLLAHHYRLSHFWNLLSSTKGSLTWIHLVNHIYAYRYIGIFTMLYVIWEFLRLE